MSFKKEAAQAVNMLMAEGVDFDSATDLVMEKIASFDEVARGAISPAWMESHIARKHGKNSPDGLGENYAIHSGANARAGLRALGEAAIGGVTGAAVSKNIGHGVLPGAIIGGLGGFYHGHFSSLSNQAKEMHEKYREKQAAVNMLIEEGVDFDSAVDLVNRKSSELYGD